MKLISSPVELKNQAVAMHQALKKAGVKVSEFIVPTKDALSAKKAEKLVSTNGYMNFYADTDDDLEALNPRIHVKDAEAPDDVKWVEYEGKVVTPPADPDPDEDDNSDDDSDPDKEE